MALVNVVSIATLGIDGEKKPINLYYPAATSLATMQTDVNAFVTAYDLAADAQVTGATVEVALTLPGGIKTAPTDGNSVHIGVSSSWDAANTDKAYNLFLPAIKNSLYVGTLPDTNDALITDLFDEVIGSYEPHGEVIIGFLSGKKKSRK